VLDGGQEAAVDELVDAVAGDAEDRSGFGRRASASMVSRSRITAGPSPMRERVPRRTRV
jgi:hypothetical protein